jgi:uncharacterized membrane protein
LDDITIARALHVLAIVHWIGGVTFVTLVLLPSIRRIVPATERLRLFETIEGRFATQARVSTLLAGATGFYMIDRLAAWDRFADPEFWWLDAMVLVWMIFTFVLFVAEQLFLHRWFHESATREPERTFQLVQRAHVVLLMVSLLTIAGGILGAHGALN